MHGHGDLTSDDERVASGKSRLPTNWERSPPEPAVFGGGHDRPFLGWWCTRKITQHSQVRRPGGSSDQIGKVARTISDALD